MLQGLSPPAPRPDAPRRPLPRQEEDFEVDFEEFGVKAGDSELDSADEAMTFAAPGVHSPEVTTGSSQSPELSLSVTPFLAAIAVPLEDKTSTVDFVWAIPLSLLFLAISEYDTELIETVMCHFREKFENLPEKFNGVEQLLQEFSLDDSFPLGAPLFMEMPHSCSMYAEKDEECFDEDTVPSELDDDDIIFEHSGSQSDRKTSGSMASSDVLTVNQLIESVHETARQVANVPVPANPVPYDQMKSQCEALVMEKQQKMSVLLSLKHSRTDSHGSAGVDGLETNESSLLSEPELQSTRKGRMRRCDSASSESDCSFRLPPASPYDKFLKAAGR